MAVTTFSLVIPKLVEKINSKIMNKTRNRVEGLRVGANSPIDSEYLIKEYISSIAHDIFDKLTSPLGRDLDDLDEPQEPFEYDVTYDPGTGDVDNCIVYRVIFPDKFDTTITPSILKSMEDSIVSYAVYNWLMDSNIQGWERFEYEFDKNFDNLRGQMVRRVNLKRTYKLY